IAGIQNVVAVLPSRKFQLQTTRSWDFLGLSTTVKRISQVESNLIVGVLDSGIWPGLESFREEGLGPPPKNWKGACHNITCNNKIIGARSYYTGDQPLDEEISVIDIDGHGTHTASTVVGMEVENASLFGLAKGTARGGVPSARIAAYKVCWTTIVGDTCQEQDLLAAFQDAIKDGVDMLSVSIGSNVTNQYPVDGLAIGSFRAMKWGILTSAAAENYGPHPSTVTNGAPWILTVGASSIDRKLLAKLELGNGQTFMVITSTYISWLVLLFLNKRLCLRVTLCLMFMTFMSWIYYVIFPQKQIKESSWCMLDMNRDPLGKIYKSISVHDPTAPLVASFSGRGPAEVTPDILKPDITAPGVDILAAYSLKAHPTPFPNDKRHSPFNFVSGTSMACPHATGVALYVKTFHPSWSPSAIKSALMTTASPINSKENPDAEFSYGSGHINPLKALNPGLVYNTTEMDYVNFLCNELPPILVKLISGDDVVNCSNSINAYELNYPTMSANVEPTKPFTVKFPRTVTNVGRHNSVYKAMSSHLLVSASVLIRMSWHSIPGAGIEIPSESFWWET
ncbi:cucumisin-like, partial [Carica papaya]|uniref:cucumisin-like n=1 Tax=Carica papaya TaxID=3649 RepID=UPI000B8CD1D5